MLKEVDHACKLPPASPAFFWPYLESLVAQEMKEIRLVFAIVRGISKTNDNQQDTLNDEQAKGTITVKSLPSWRTQEYCFYR